MSDRARCRTTRRLPAWVARWARRFLGLPLALALAGAAEAQSSAPPRTVINKTAITLPIILDNAVRPHLQEVQLYVKDSPGAPWVLKERAPATQSFFAYKAPGEGEYSFNVVTVDRAGRSVPADINREPPGLIVVVDMKGPEIDLQTLESTDKGHQVRVDVRDPNHDPSRTRFFFQTADKNWRPLDCLPGTPEHFCVPGQAALTGMVRAQATDKANNTTTREFNLYALKPGLASVTPMAPPPGVGGVVMADAAGGKTHLTPPPAMLPPKSEGMTPPAKDPGSLKDRVTIVTHREPAPLPGPSLELPPPPRTDKAPPLSVELPPRTVDPKVITLPPAKHETRDPLRDLAPANIHMASNTNVLLDYQIEALGASGVGKVEVWMTRDRGQSWNRIGEDKDLKSPAEVTLPGEGVFGISLVVSNGRGFGGAAPQPGDQPDYWVEVDVTRPSGEIMGVRPAGSDDGSLIVTWNARDKKLAPEPIDLYFAVNREGPWTPIAKGVRNDGSYRWMPPRDVAAHAFIRMIVTDMAGNSVTCETPTPVALDDLSRPRGRVLGVSSPPPPRGGIID